MENKFDKTKFVVCFDSVLTNKKMGNAFYKFLLSEHNSESYDFLMDVQNLETLKEDKQQIEKAKLIFSTYININSEKELNISGEIREKTIHSFREQHSNSNKWILEKSPKELFYECFHIISNVLRHDPFKRFIRTDECEKIMKIYQNHNSVISPVIAINFMYQMSDFKHPYIEDKDFDFFKALMEDGYNWEVKKNKFKYFS
jgi:hypothetical protein